MKEFLTAAVAWLSADPAARFVRRGLVGRSSLSSNSPESGTSSATPAGAQAQQAHQVVLIKTDSTEVVPPPSTGLGSALYTMTNTDGGANVILAFALNSGDGKVNTSAPVARYSNNGNGLRFPSAVSNLQYALDSQDSLVQAGARLFAVNAGSSTFQAWGVNCTNATSLVPLGGAVSLNGKNPNTLAVAQANEIVCVATTGNGAGIECYTYSTGFTPKEITPPQFFSGTKVSLPLPVAQNGAKPTGPTDTVSQLLFTDDESHLIAIVKGQGNSTTGAVTASGYINIYPITSKGLGTPVQSKPAGTSFLYGCTLQFNTFNLFCSDAGVGAVFLSSQSDLTYKVTVSTASSSFGGGTNGWAARSPYSNGPNYISPLDKNYIAAFDKSGKYIATTNFATSNQIGGSNPQPVELTTAANYIYALSYGSNSVNQQHIAVIQDVGLKGNLNAVQNVAVNSIPNSAGVTNAISGLAVFIPPNQDSTDACDFE